MRKVWTSTTPFDFEGRFYRFKDVFSEAKPFQQPYPPLFFGGSSPGRWRWGPGTAIPSPCSVSRLPRRPNVSPSCGRMMQPNGRQPRFNVSFRPIIADTEGAAWDKAKKILADLQAGGVADQAAGQVRRASGRTRPPWRRARRAAWMPVAGAAAGKGNTSMPRRNARAGRGGDAEVLPPRRRFVPDPWIRPAGGCRGFRS